MSRYLHCVRQPNEVLTETVYFLGPPEGLLLTPKPSPLFPWYSTVPPRLGRIHSRVPRVWDVNNQETGVRGASQGGWRRIPSEASTTPGIPNPPFRSPQAGIPITSLSQRTIRCLCRVSTFHTMAMLEILRFPPGISDACKLALVTPIFSPEVVRWISAPGCQLDQNKVRLQSPFSPQGWNQSVSEVVLLQSVSVESGSIRFGSSDFAM